MAVTVNVTACLGTRERHPVSNYHQSALASILRKWERASAFAHLFPVPGADFGERSLLFLLCGGFVLQELSSELCVDLAQRLVALLLFLEANL